MYANTVESTVSSVGSASSTSIPWASSREFQEASRFLALLGGENDTFCFQAFGDPKDRRGDKSLTRCWHGTFARSFADLQALNERGAGIFVAVNETDGTSRKKENIARVRAVFADFDNGVP